MPALMIISNRARSHLLPKRDTLQFNKAIFRGVGGVILKTNCTKNADKILVYTVLEWQPVCPVT